VALVGASQTSSQTELVDLGETDLLTLSCDFINDRAAEEKVPIKYCRRVEEIQISDTEAEVSLKVKTDFEKLYIKFNFRKTLWNIDKWEIYDRK